MPATSTTAVLNLHMQGRETAWQGWPGKRRPKIASKRGGGSPQIATPSPAPLDHDGERAEGSKCGCADAGQRAGDPLAAVGIHDEAGELAGGKEEEECGQLAPAGWLTVAARSST